LEISNLKTTVYPVKGFELQPWESWFAVQPADQWTIAHPHDQSLSS